MLKLEEALERIVTAMPQPRSECVPLKEGHGRILAANLEARVALPPFDNSAMDGYAVRASDVTGATAESPVCLQLVGKVAAGESFRGEVTGGTCVRLFTGSPLPRGADAVVMQEDTCVESSPPGIVLFLDAVKPWEHVRLCGEDVREGTRLVSSGEALSAGRLSLLAACGHGEAPVGRQPRLALLATGSELRTPGQPLGCGHIYESNRIALAQLARQAGALPEILPLVPDTLHATRAALESAFAQMDMVVTSGGVSVGELDFVKRAFEEAGGSLEFWRVAIKPGRPFVFGRWGEKFLFGLPGNPASAVVTFLLLVRPAILRWQGAAELFLPAHPGQLAEAMNNPGERRHFVRVRIDASGQVYSAGAQGSHLLSSLAAANALLDLPARTQLPAGAPVSVLRWQ